MYELEFIIFCVSGFFAVRFFLKWYQLLFGIWVLDRGGFSRILLGWLPPVSFAVIFYALKVMASFDVVGSGFYILFYILLGYACLYFGLMLMAYFLDISWKDDCMNLQNKAAVLAVAGGFLGLTVIYSGANLGDGPGWWCVLFAGGLGLAAWIVLGMLLSAYTRVSERITVDRDVACGIRFGSYLLAGGIILGRASAGDWTSFYMTIVEFMAGWPVLLLTLAAFLAEKYYIHKAEREEGTESFVFTSSIILGILYFIAAVVSVILLPAPNENPLYSSLPVITWSIL